MTFPFFKNNKTDFLAVGDIVTDAFIRIKEGHVNCLGDKCELCISYGDKVPFESVEIVRAVGNSANAAVAVSRLGLKSSLVASVGDDEEGEKCLLKLEGENVRTDYVEINKGKKTNYHYVLWYDKDRTILVKHEDFKYNFPKNAKPKWIYLSSLGEHALSLHDEIADFLDKNPDTKLAFQPGTFQMKLGIERLNKIYKKSEIFFCNVEEAERILGKSGGVSIIKELLSGIRALGPKIAVITDGPNGSYADDGAEQFFLPAFPDQKPAYERTGAGDCFASTTVAGLILGKSIEDSMKWGSVNSMSVVQEVGAQKGLLSQNKIQEFLKTAPQDWNKKII